MTMLDTSILSQSMPERGTEPLAPEIKILEETETYGRFAFEPLERGYGITVGNPMRRMLLSSIEGTAITWVKIDDVLHEYSTVPNMKEEVMEFLLNVKGICIRSLTGRPGKMRLEIRGEGRVCAGDIATSADFEIVNPELHLATLDSEDAVLSVEFNVDHGKGYQPVPQGGDVIGGPLMGVLPIDAIYNPVRKVNYSVERTRVGHVTDYERLVLEVWTDGTIGPVEALRKSSDALVSHFYSFKNLGKELGGGPDRPTISVPPEVYQTPIEKLELSPRTLNCLKRAQITKVGHVLEKSNSELLKVRNFGEKSLLELMDRLRDEGMLTADELAARTGHSVDTAEGAGPSDAPGEDGAADTALSAGADGQPGPEGVLTEDFIRAAQEALGRVSADDGDVVPQFESNEAPIFPEPDATEEEDVDEEDDEE